MTKVIRLLIVEDDRRIAEIQRRFVEQIKDTEICGIAHSLAHARDLAEVMEPDLVLLDVTFPEGSGMDLLREWRSANRKTDVILITASREVDTLKAALHSGVFDYILKPLVFERLQETIEKYRDHQQRLAELGSLEQQKVDQMIPRVDTPTVPAQQEIPPRLPKGIDGLTLDRIRQIIIGGGQWSAEEMGEAIGASRTTARRYLEYLISTDELTAQVTYGQVGRPERRYSRRVQS